MPAADLGWLSINGRGLCSCGRWSASGCEPCRRGPLAGVSLRLEPGTSEAQRILHDAQSSRQVRRKELCPRSVNELFDGRFKVGFVLAELGELIFLRSVVDRLALAEGHAADGLERVERRVGERHEIRVARDELHPEPGNFRASPCPVTFGASRLRIGSLGVSLGGEPERDFLCLSSVRAAAKALQLFTPSCRSRSAWSRFAARL